MDAQFNRYKRLAKAALGCLAVGGLTFTTPVSAQSVTNGTAASDSITRETVFSLEKARLVSHLLGRESLECNLVGQWNLNNDGALDAADLLAVRNNPTDVIVQTIGTDGGTVSIGDARVKLSAGAFAEPVILTVGLKRNTAPALSPENPYDPQVSFDFINEVSVTITSTDCGVPKFSNKRLPTGSAMLTITVPLASPGLDGGSRKVVYAGARAGQQIAIGMVRTVETGANYVVELGKADLQEARNELQGTGADGASVRYVAGFFGLSRETVTTGFYDIETGRGQSDGFSPTSRENLIIAVHGFSASERMWSPLRQGLMNDPVVAGKLPSGRNVWGLRYDTGQRVATSGREIADLMHSKIDGTPNPKRLFLVAHSTGGLVTREAISIGEARGDAWVDKVEHVVFLASPHDGTPLESNLRKILTSQVLSGEQGQLHPLTASLEALLELQSESIQDLETGLSVNYTAECTATADVRHSIIYGTAGFNSASLAWGDDVLNVTSDGAVPVLSAMDRADGILCLDLVRNPSAPPSEANERVESFNEDHFNVYPPPKPGDTWSNAEVLADVRYMAIRDFLFSELEMTPTPTMTATPTPTPSPQPTLGGLRTIHLPGDINLYLAKIPAGSFIMGSPEDERGRNTDEGPLTHVTLTQDFYMGRYEVTQAQWFALMGRWPNREPNSDDGAGDDYPIYGVSWDDAQDFCTVLSTYIALSGQGSLTARLPTEAEWEYACRAGTRTRFSFGDSLIDGPYGDAFEDDGIRTQYMWYGAERNAPPPFRIETSLTPVGQRRGNNFGLYDMHGNILEWCQDRSGSYVGGRVTDPTGPALGSYRVIRGNFWWSTGARHCRSASRSSGHPQWTENAFVGFRVAIDP